MFPTFWYQDSHMVQGLLLFCTSCRLLLCVLACWSSDDVVGVLAVTRFAPRGNVSRHGMHVQLVCPVNQKTHNGV
jgi:hypothetical protein